MGDNPDSISAGLGVILIQKYRHERGAPIGADVGGEYRREFELAGLVGESRDWFEGPDCQQISYRKGGFFICAVLLVLLKLKQHPYLHEVVYVSDLKQQLNRIYRKQKCIETSAGKNDPDAIAAMYFSYRGSKQLNEFDDNTITLDTIALKLKALERRIDDPGLTITTDSYREAMRERF